MWYFDIGFGLIGKTTTTGNVLNSFNPQDQWIRDLAWDGSSVWAVNTSGMLKEFSIDGDLQQTISGLISNGWGLTYDGCYLWASDPQKDRIYRIALGAALKIDSDSLPAGVRGMEYIDTLSASGGCPPYRWRLLEGNLPEGLRLDSLGVISGLPTKAQLSTFTVKVSDSPQASDTREFSIQIADTSGLAFTSEGGLPAKFSLLQNYPNPFNGSTEIGYILPKECHIELAVYNIFGEKVATLVEGEQRAGYGRIRWEVSSLPSGVYLYRLRAGGMEMTKRMMILR